MKSHFEVSLAPPWAARALFAVIAFWIWSIEMLAAGYARSV